MAIDIFIAVLLCAVTIVMGYLGVHVTLHPTEEPRKQRRFKAGFSLCGILAISLIAMQTARNASTQSSLRTQLDKIQRNTEQPPKIEVNIPPAQVVVKNGEIRQRVGLERKRFSELGDREDGSIVYCVDCTVASGTDDTCTAGGEGMLAVRKHGRWTCI